MTRRALKYSSIAAGFAFLAVFFGLAIMNTPKSDAISAMDFRAGNIIDDEVFYDKNTMSVSDIQAHLNRYMPACDTWGTGVVGGGRYINGRAVPSNTSRADYARQMRAAGNSRYHDPPYICVQNYYENPETKRNLYDSNNVIEPGMISAAQIIYNAAQKYNINPQVLLVLLKKESYVWGDNWPLRYEYNTVMGYACPDTAPCDAKYFGFYNQVEMAAWQINYYKDHIYSYNYRPYATNSILYSPVVSCGRKSVYLENIATTSLYIYTPYTPNDAALRNYPGTADCGSYGNRNFFMYFNEWFGDTHAPAASKKIEAKYEELGGEAHLGKQITGTRSNNSTGIYYREYENGLIVGNERFGYHESSGKIREVWQKQNFEMGALGFPTSDIRDNPETGIIYQDYQGGVIVGNDKYGYHVSSGKIREVWQKQNFEMGALGFPVGDVLDNPGSGIVFQQYEGGFIVGNDRYGFYESRGKIREVWEKQGFEWGPLGFPISEIQTNEISGIIYQEYQGGFIVGNEEHGYYVSSGKIRDVWTRQDCEHGPLGFPVGEVQENKGSGIVFQQYEGGFIVGNDRYGFYESRGKIREVWEKQGFEWGLLGFPISEIQTNEISGIFFQQYQGGFIVGNDKYGYYESRGRIRDVWAKQNCEHGTLGFPVGEIQENKGSGIIFQQYQGGFIVGNDRYGYYESRGKIREVWEKQGFEWGPLGFPVSEIRDNPKTGIIYQEYQGGFIVGNEKYGYYESRGKLREYWQSQNFEIGWMGFPLSEIRTSGDTISQEYQAGTLYYHKSSNRFDFARK
ncbi:hypothetical protein IKF25_00545 [Candidatus Saccharibacteria bacterium]|nr:hypothetical protein [Candidatus Saccharibacteria bacterium]